MWVIFTDSQAALKAIQTAPAKTGNPPLLYELLFLYAMAINKGNQIAFRWVTGHTALPGNDAADGAATRGHGLESVDPASEDIKLLVKQLGHHKASQNWSSPESHYKPTYKLDPHLLNHLPNGMPRQLETLPHCIRLNAAITRAFQYKIGLATSANCDTCNVEADFTHVLCECVQFRNERLHLINELQNVSYQPFSLEKIMGPQRSHLHQRISLKALITFLEQTELIDEL